MNSFFDRITEAIYAAKHQQHFRYDRTCLLVLIPPQEYRAAMAGIDHMMHGTGTAQYTAIFGAREEQLNRSCLRVMGVNCQLIEADVPQTIFSMGEILPVPLT